MQGEDHGKVVQSELAQGRHSHYELQGFSNLENPKKSVGIILQVMEKLWNSTEMFAQIVSA